MIHPCIVDLYRSPVNSTVRFLSWSIHGKHNVYISSQQTLSQIWKKNFTVNLECEDGVFQKEYARTASGQQWEWSRIEFRVWEIMNERGLDKGKEQCGEFKGTDKGLAASRNTSPTWNTFAKLSKRAWPALTLCLTPLTVPFLLRMLTRFVPKPLSLVALTKMSKSSCSFSFSSHSDPTCPFCCPSTSLSRLVWSVSELLAYSESSESAASPLVYTSFSTLPLCEDATRNRTFLDSLSLSAFI